MAVSDEDFLASIKADVEAMAAMSKGRLDAPVPACPGWDVKELLVHTGGVHRFWHAIAAGPLADPSEVDETGLAPPDEDDEVISWFADGGRDLVATLATTPSDARCWTWSSIKNVGFIKRRMAQETAVHRVDAEQATGTERSVGTALAADGIDEFVTHMMTAYQGDTPITGNGEAVRLVQSDGSGSWAFTLTPDGVEVSADHPSPDAEAKGTASDLLLVLWRRLPVERLEIDGDRSVIDSLVEASALD